MYYESNGIQISLLEKLSHLQFCMPSDDMMGVGGYSYYYLNMSGAREGEPTLELELEDMSRVYRDKYGLYRQIRFSPITFTVGIHNVRKTSDLIRVSTFKSLVKKKISYLSGPKSAIK